MILEIRKVGKPLATFYKFSNTEMSEKIMLIDGNSLINRAFYAIPILTNKDGEFTNAVYGFFNIFFKLYDEEKPDYIGVAFDLPKPTFRHNIYKEYKGTRKKMPNELRSQMPMLKNLLKLMGLKIFEMEGYEADDILGTLAKKSEESGLSVVIVTGDRDLLQCASDNIRIRIPKTKSGKTEVENYCAKDIIEKFGVTPSEFVSVKALMGDATDNIPGVAGIGEKTAYKIIQQYKTIENAIANANEIKPKKASENLIKYKEQANLSFELAKIDTSVPILFDADEAKVVRIYTLSAYKEMLRLGFKTMLPRFDNNFDNNKSIKIFGLTGNIGSGKSTVSKILEKMGGFIIDADKLGHECILYGNVAYDEIVQEFGAEILSEDKEIDRKLLGKIVFSDSEKLDILSKITHKHIIKETDVLISKTIKEIVKNEKSYKFIVIDAPLLFEAGMEKICDKVILVTAEESVRIDRILKRDNLSIESAKKRVTAQKSSENYKSYVDIIIENNSDMSLEQLSEQVNQCFMPLVSEN